MCAEMDWKFWPDINAINKVPVSHHHICYGRQVLHVCGNLNSFVHGRKGSDVAMAFPLFSCGVFTGIGPIWKEEESTVLVNKQLQLIGNQSQRFL